MILDWLMQLTQSALVLGLAAEFVGLWWADYVATALILSFVAKEGIESYNEARGEENLPGV